MPDYDAHSGSFGSEPPHETLAEEPVPPNTVTVVIAWPFALDAFSPSADSISHTPGETIGKARQKVSLYARHVTGR